MDSPGNFCMYDSEYFVEDKNLHNKRDEVFLFGADDSMNFGGLAEYTGLFENENSIDLNAYIHQAPSSLNTESNTIQLSELLPSSSSPTKATILTEVPPLIRPDESLSSCQPSQPNSTQFLQNISSPPATGVINYNYPMPSPHTQFMPKPQDLKEEVAALQVKAEPQECVEPASEYLPAYDDDDEDDDEDDTSTYTSGPSRPVSPVLSSPTQRGRRPSRGNNGSNKRRGPAPNKDSDEYRQKRQKNNIAVRRSRQKSKVKSAELQGRVTELTDENDRLNKRVELLTKELTVLKSLFTNVGKAPPSHLANM